MKSKAKAIISIAAVLFLLGAGAAAYLYLNLKGSATWRETYVYLPAGATYQTLLDSLGNDGDKVNDLATFERVAGWLDFETPRPGKYHLKEGVDYLTLVRMFQRGWQSPQRVTFNNIRLLPQLAGRVGGQIEADSLAIAEVLLNDTTPAHYGFTKETFIGMFLPDTYEVYWNITPAAFLDRMKREYDNFWTAQREQKLTAAGLSRQEAITLASIVYEETKMSDEMPTVAGVYINRLNRGMMLQADPTVKFAVGDFTLKRIWERHLKTDSPYNTYMHTGLPPGPICMPSKKAIDAVLNYQHHDYIFFCAKDDFSGYHSFARTNAEHERNRSAWQKALNRAGIR